MISQQSKNKTKTALGIPKAAPIRIKGQNQGGSSFCRHCAEKQGVSTARLLFLERSGDTGGVSGRPRCQSLATRARANFTPKVGTGHGNRSVGREKTVALYGKRFVQPTLPIPASVGPAELAPLISVGTGHNRPEAERIGLLGSYPKNPLLRKHKG